MVMEIKDKDMKYIVCKIDLVNGERIKTPIKKYKMISCAKNACYRLHEKNPEEAYAVESEND
jgi:hypothetical protein